MVKDLGLQSLAITRRAKVFFGGFFFCLFISLVPGTLGVDINIIAWLIARPRET